MARNLSDRPQWSSEKDGNFCVRVLRDLGIPLPFLGWGWGGVVGEESWELQEWGDVYC